MRDPGGGIRSDPEYPPKSYPFRSICDLSQIDCFRLVVVATRAAAVFFALIGAETIRLGLKNPVESAM